MDISKVGVLGFGIMGQGIAHNCAQFGFQVTAVDTADELIDKGFGVISSVLKKRVERGKTSQKEMDELLGRIKGSKNMDDFEDCDLVIEAVTEDLTLKKTMFEALDRICPAHAILATNTSVLSVTQIAVATKKPEKVLGLHFAQPVPVMKLVEVIRTPATSDETMAIAQDFCKAIGKDVVIAKDTPGFISNRSTSIYLLNAVRMLEAGYASAEDIDKIHTLGLGHPMGPLALLDMMGLDTVLRGATAIYEETKEPAFNPPSLMRQMVALGWCGRKTGKGFYNY